MSRISFFMTQFGDQLSMWKCFRRLQQSRFENLYLFKRIGGGVRSRVRILLGSAKSATLSVIVGFGVPGFGYLLINLQTFLITSCKQFLIYLNDLISGYKLTFPLSAPYHGNFCSNTSESLNTPYNIKWPSLDIQIAVFDPRISSVKKAFNVIYIMEYLIKCS